MLFSQCKFTVDGKRLDGKTIEKKGETGQDGWLGYKNDSADDQT